MMHEYRAQHGTRRHSFKPRVEIGCDWTSKYGLVWCKNTNDVLAKAIILLHLEPCLLFLLFWYHNHGSTALVKGQQALPINKYSKIESPVGFAQSIDSYICPVQNTYSSNILFNSGAFSNRWESVPNSSSIWNLKESTTKQKRLEFLALAPIYGNIKTGIFLKVA